MNPASHSLVEKIANDLRNQIIVRKLEDNTQLRQEKLAKEFGVSRIPIREALRILESEGLVTISPNIGAKVAHFDLTECIEIYKIRERIESLALSESIRNLSTDKITEIRKLAVKIENSRENLNGWLILDREFHLATYSGLSSKRLHKMMTGFWNTTQHYRRELLATFSDKDFDFVDRDHFLIVEAIADNNLRFAEEILRSHIQRTRNHFEIQDGAT
jgi:DNA-binding GntR family transcriptional regulator